VQAPQLGARPCGQLRRHAQALEPASS
jgi:hypothetical protein